jgi:demethylmenaquinone methyltransferase/2-methoxy-6-polyprenyl-1,4-benzoquinol methylase
MNYLTSFGFSIRWRRQCLASLAPTDKQIEMLDLLSGMGETWSAARRRFPNANLSAIDFSEEMMKRARNKSRKYFHNSVSLFQQDVLRNTLPANHFDIIICAFGLKTFTTEQLKALALEIKRMLKDGGQFAFVEVSKPNNHILNALYGFYLARVIPVLGRLFSGNPSEYRMLWRYTENFVSARAAMEIFSSVGLNTKYASYFFDCATGFSGEK